MKMGQSKSHVAAGADLEPVSGKQHPKLQAAPERAESRSSIREPNQGHREPQLHAASKKTIEEEQVCLLFPCRLDTLGSP